MLSLQEAVQKTEVKPQLKAVQQCLDTGRFHPDIASIYNVESDALRMQLQETLNHIPLHEFLAKSGSTGIAGAAYMVPDKIHDELIAKSIVSDIVPLIGRVVTGWAGGDLKVDVVNDLAYRAKEFSSGGRMPTETVETMQPTITPVSFGIAPRITNDLIEDASWQMVQYHLDRAAVGMGVKSSNMALTVLKTATDGWGTVYASATGDSAETKYTGGATADVHDCVQQVGRDKWIANTLVTTSESWQHSISLTGVAAVLNGLTAPIEAPPDYMFHMKFQNIDVLLNNSDALHLSTDADGTFTRCVTIVFDRNNALLTGRKRWMQINNYSEPVRDLAGCTITARQDSVTLYDDAIAVLTETV